MPRALFIASLALAFSFPAWADLTGNVVGVADGDTITVLDADKVQHKIRLTGIDAPEKNQPFGNRSKQSLSDMVFNKIVTVETVKRDRYGRELGKVLIGGKDANLEQIRAGLAWHYKAYEREQTAADRNTYAVAENEAKAAKRGLWVDVEPTPPWEWRHDEKEGKTEGASASNDNVVKKSTSNEGVVKKSRSGICHAPDSTYYARTKNFTPFKTLDECLKSGGRLPKR